MKIEKNNQYFTIACYTAITSLIIVLGALILFNIRMIWATFCNIIGIGYWLLKPLIFGMIFAYLFDPIVEFYEKRCGKWNDLKFRFHRKVSKTDKKQLQKKRWHKRNVSTFFAYITIAIFLGLFVLIIVMNIEEIAGNFSFSGFKESIDRYLEYFEQMVQGVNQFAQDFGVSPGQVSWLQKIYGMLNSFIIGISTNIINSLTSIGINAMNVFLALVVAFYLLQDKECCIAFGKRVTLTILRPRLYRHFSILSKDIDYVFSGYIRGQLIDAFIIAILTSLSLTLIQLDFAIIIGIIAGIFNLIPYFGPIVGFVLAVIIGLLDPNPMKAVYGALAIFVIQQIDGWIIVPKVVGECVKLHPVVVLLAILIGGNLFGLVGMLIGVPIAAFIRLVLLRYMTEIFPDGEAVLKEEMEEKNNDVSNPK